MLVAYSQGRGKTRREFALPGEKAALRRTGHNEFDSSTRALHRHTVEVRVPGPELVAEQAVSGADGSILAQHLHLLFTVAFAHGERRGGCAFAHANGKKIATDLVGRGLPVRVANAGAFETIPGNPPLAAPFDQAR